MNELITQLVRLYLPPGRSAPAGLADHLEGRVTIAVDLSAGGATRAIVLPFEKQNDQRQRDHWQRLCEVANALQAELGLPAPAVSVSGATGFRLWLSLAEPVPLAVAQRFADALRAAYFSDAAAPFGVDAPVELPPSVNMATRKWAAFIHPGMGASFADEPALEMTPPAGAQAAFLEGLHSISAAQFRHATTVLAGAAGPVVGAAPLPSVTPGLLLENATLEDIVRHLHALNIEPTFRHLLPR